MELEKNDMKITYADRPNWSRVLAKSFAMDYVTRPDFTGCLIYSNKGEIYGNSC